MSPCVLGLGFIKCIWSSSHWSRHDNRWVNFLVHFCDMRKGWHKGHLMGYYPSSRYITPVTSWSSWFSTTIDISSELNWSKINKNWLFSPILSWFYFAVTLSWPWGDTPVKPNPIPCHHVYLGWDSSNVFEVLAIGPNMTTWAMKGLNLVSSDGPHSLQSQQPKG